MGEERARKREDLLRATEDELRRIAEAAARARPGPKNRDTPNKALGEKANRWKMRKHFDIEVRDDALIWTRNQLKIDAEARLDGIYVIRSSLTSTDIGTEQAVEAYKSLSQVERAFRTVKTARLKVRPIHVYNTNRVRAHVFLCVLAYYVEWHMRRTLAMLLFEDDRDDAKAKRNTPVEKATVSDSAKAKADTRATPDGLPVHSFDTLLQDLATLTLNEVTLPNQPDTPFRLHAEPAALQSKAFELLGLKPDVYSKLTGKIRKTLFIQQDCLYPSDEVPFGRPRARKTAPSAPGRDRRTLRGRNGQPDSPAPSPRGGCTSAAPPPVRRPGTHRALPGRTRRGGAGAPWSN